MSLTLEHVSRLQPALSNIRLYLRPHGRFIAVLAGRYGAASIVNRILPSRLSRGLLERLFERPPETVFPARYESCSYSALAALLESDWEQWEIAPVFVGGRYFLPSRPLAALYLAYEEWALAAGRKNLAPYYVIDARADG